MLPSLDRLGLQHNSYWNDACWFLLQKIILKTLIMQRYCTLLHSSQQSWFRLWKVMVLFHTRLLAWPYLVLVFVFHFLLSAKPSSRMNYELRSFLKATSKAQHLLNASPLQVHSLMMSRYGCQSHDSLSVFMQVRIVIIVELSRFKTTMQDK